MIMLSFDNIIGYKYIQFTKLFSYIQIEAQNHQS